MVEKAFLNRKVTLVLGGGGARGLVHIGIIRRLEELGYEIDEVVGACRWNLCTGEDGCSGRMDAAPDEEIGL